MKPRNWRDYILLSAVLLAPLAVFGLAAKLLGGVTLPLAVAAVYSAALWWVYFNDRFFADPGENDRDGSNF